MTMRIALAQFNASVGDIQGNIAGMSRLCKQGRLLDADLVVFPEMCLCGYPPEDLLLKKHFLRHCRAQLELFAHRCGDTAVLVGFAELDGEDCYNSLAVCRAGRIEAIYRKGKLPNYGVFDERRYFRPGNAPVCINVKGSRIALTVCEDIWQLEWLDGFRRELGDFDLLVNVSASPFHVGKAAQRERVLSNCARHFDSPVAYCNLVGGQDELVFDGRSMIVNAAGQVVCHAAGFVEDMLVVDMTLSDDGGDGGAEVVQGAQAQGPAAAAEAIDPIADVYDALVLGTRDYVRKNGFERVLIGLSGGIDSSLTAVIAVDALGPGNVVGVTMPSQFNSPETIGDAQQTAENLDMEFHTVPIKHALEAFGSAMGHVPGWSDEGIAYENLQARIRGTILMSLSNKFGYMVLTTGNKSETAVGYSTLYGDTAGGFAVIKDVPKTMVYQISRYVNQVKGAEVIPESVIVRPPSAELRDNQKDSDSLPPYDLLDEVLRGYVEDDLSVGQLIKSGLDAETVRRVTRLVDRNEYKRRQCPPGVKITPRAFGKDRRMPITNRYTDD